jgi:predicted nucleic acid-binding protein
VLVELVVAGRHQRAARALLVRYAASSRVTLVSAAHGLIEATDAIRRLVIRGLATPEQGLAASDQLAQFDLVLDPTGPRIRRVWSLRDSMSAYDAAYAAAAEAFGAPLVTVDGRLLRACTDAGIPAVHLDDVD